MIHRLFYLCPWCGSDLGSVTPEGNTPDHKVVDADTNSCRGSGQPPQIRIAEVRE